MNSELLGVFAQYAHMRAPSILISSCVFILATIAGCGDDGGGSADASTLDASLPDAVAPDAAVAPIFRNPVTLPDAELAVEALKRLGVQSVGGTENCTGCHAVTRQHVNNWRALTDVAMTDCFTDLEVTSQSSALAMIDCMRMLPTDDSTPFAPGKTGVISSAAELDWFEFVFWRAYGDGYETEYAEFLDRVGMPRGNYPKFSQADFDIVAEWFLRGVPELDNTLPFDPPPTECTPGISADVAAHVADMAVNGWHVKNEANNILMFGCDQASEAIDCLSDYPLASEQTYGSGWEEMENAKLRVLFETAYDSAFWTRSSADGRYVANGAWTGGFDSAIVDLQKQLVIPTAADYDPGFFPDNSGFAFQGGIAYFCEQQILNDSPSSITYNEPECNATNQVGLYQHIGTALNGTDYFSVDSQFVSDSGGGFGATTDDPDAGFSSNADVDFVTLIHTGSQFMTTQKIDIPTPFEGDAVLSPSAGLVVTRVAGPGDNQLGFVLRRVDATMTQSGYDIEIPEIARYCISGGKPGFSFNERWMAYHSYIGDEDAVELGYSGPNDPGFQDYRNSGGANVYIMDLLTGQSTLVTRMNPGQYALYPHFRSDGWMYFIVRDLNSGSIEYIVASDAALVLESQ